MKMKAHKKDISKLGMPPTPLALKASRWLDGNCRLMSCTGSLQRVCCRARSCRQLGSVCNAAPLVCRRHIECKVD